MNTGRLTCAYKLTTEMFRCGSSRLLGFYGTNLQNSSESLMRCVVPAKDNIIVTGDQSGAEALIVAMETRPGKFRKLFDLNIKVHSYMALQLFTEKFANGHPVSRYKNVDPDTLKSYPECKELLSAIKHSTREYDLGKRVIHAKNYSMGPRTFQLNVLELSEGSVALSFKESKEFLATHEQTFPEILEWQGQVKGVLAATRTLRNLYGYPRHFGHLWNDELERQALAFIPQSTVAVITHKAFTELFWRIKREKLPWTLLNQKHDSITLECPEVHGEKACQYLKEHLGRELTSSRGEKFRMGVGLSIGKNFGHYDEKENPNGLKEL